MNDCGCITKTRHIDQNLVPKFITVFEIHQIIPQMRFMVVPKNGDTKRYPPKECRVLFF